MRWSSLLIIFVIVITLFLFRWRQPQTQVENEVIVLHEPMKVFPNLYGSPHSVVANTNENVDWTYELTRVSGGPNKNFDGSYIDNWTLGRLVKAAPSPDKTNCYQYICPSDMLNANCWRCGK